MLTQKLGYGVTQGEPYYTPGCNSTAQCVFPNAVIPHSAWSAPAQHLLQYIPTPNIGSNQFSTSAYPETVRDDKGGGPHRRQYAARARFRATTSSTTTGWIIRIRAGRAAQACPVSTL